VGVGPLLESRSIIFICFFLVFQIINSRLNTKQFKLIGRFYETIQQNYEELTLKDSEAELVCKACRSEQSKNLQSEL